MRTAIELLFLAIRGRMRFEGLEDLMRIDASGKIRFDDEDVIDVEVEEEQAWDEALENGLMQARVEGEESIPSGFRMSVEEPDDDDDAFRVSECERQAGQVMEILAACATLDSPGTGLLILQSALERAFADGYSRGIRAGIRC
jgi:hypothetical protein